MLQDLGETRCYITLSCRAYSGADPQALLTGPPAGTNPQRLWSTLRFSLDRPASPSSAPTPERSTARPPVRGEPSSLRRGCGHSPERAEGSERARLPFPGVAPVFHA